MKRLAMISITRSRISKYLASLVKRDRHLALKLCLDSGIVQVLEQIEAMIGDLVMFPERAIDHAQRRQAFGHADLGDDRSEEHTSELQSRPHLVCRLLLEKKKTPKLIKQAISATKALQQP